MTQCSTFLIRHTELFLVSYSLCFQQVVYHNCLLDLCQFKHISHILKYMYFTLYLFHLQYFQCHVESYSESISEKTQSSSPLVATSAISSSSDSYKTLLISNNSKMAYWCSYGFQIFIKYLYWAILTHLDNIRNFFLWGNWAI